MLIAFNSWLSYSSSGFGSLFTIYLFFSILFSLRFLGVPAMFCPYHLLYSYSSFLLFSDLCPVFFSELVYGAAHHRQ
ncbi:hypothetical protein HOY80DRAFT_985200 [Tuber brumale]|nr:hypothetical protein HOY80DRAFT_985200 [Tuber brumale]